MSSVGLNEIVGKAAINHSFQRGLLGARRAECLRQLQAKLEPEEVAAVMEIQASTVWEFAVAIERLIAKSRARENAAELTVAPEVFQPVGWPKLAASGVYLRHE
jgi:hypothetical protein